jgi:hypothetical protein
MKKEVVLKFKNGRYELMYSENGYAMQVSWNKLIAELFGGWSYNPEEEVLTICFKHGNVITQTDYDFPFNPEELPKMEYSAKLNKQIENLFKKLEKDYLEFLQEMKELEFEKEIFSIEY